MGEKKKEEIKKQIIKLFENRKYSTIETKDYLLQVEVYDKLNNKMVINMFSEQETTAFFIDNDVDELTGEYKIFEIKQVKKWNVIY